MISHKLGKPMDLLGLLAGMEVGKIKYRSMDDNPMAAAIPKIPNPPWVMSHDNCIPGAASFTYGKIP